MALDLPGRDNRQRHTGTGDLRGPQVTWRRILRSRLLAACTGFVPSADEFIVGRAGELDEAAGPLGKAADGDSGDRARKGGQDPAGR